MSTDSSQGAEGTEGTGTTPQRDLPADAASRGELPADPDNTDPTPGSDNDGIEPGYTPPSGT